ncbi:protoporphyrinogen oxidase [Priestia filamentosa]|uniref:protoporphyrinogen oxidase n=1 Tax=Priestia filamentosa TaxID=1402861 RepID=UPI001FB477E8|nr:protoporphyrinogen oxidase [Priestia filamentosa]MED3729251.1 protoporphyrinogen oxidase [Priestia filamentosa]UOE59134.1 protoporphyrinogen oxidase [Priestia filamentosa]
MKTVVVIGGGITGLSAMYELQKWKKANGKDVRLVLAEASNQLGGKIRTVKRNSFLMEAGADSIVSRKLETMPVIEELGLEKDVVYNATGRSYIYTDGELKPIPDDAVFGIPASIESLAKSTLVSAEGKVAAMKDLYTTNKIFTKNDSIGSFLEYFLGTELVEKQIAPVLSGVYSGKLSDLTIASTLPYLIDYKEKYGSVIKGLEANKQKFKGGERKFLSFQNGLDTLIDAFEENLVDAEILKNTKVHKIEKENSHYRVYLNNQERIEADYIILSIPHTVAESLINDPDLKNEFAGLKSSSLVSVYLGFDVPDSILPADGTGFITANTNELFCNACTWTSRKWGHTSKSGNLLVRLFYKSSHPSFASLKNMNKEELLEIALGDIHKSLGIDAEPIASEVTNWTDQMPNYLIIHPQSVEALESKMAADYPGIILAGCSYYGVGIPDCIKNGGDSARKLIQMF